MRPITCDLDVYKSRHTKMPIAAGCARGLMLAPYRPICDSRRTRPAGLQRHRRNDWQGAELSQDAHGDGPTRAYQACLSSLALVSR